MRHHFSFTGFFVLHNLQFGCLSFVFYLLNFLLPLNIVLFFLFDELEIVVSKLDPFGLQNFHVAFEPSEMGDRVDETVLDPSPNDEFGQHFPPHHGGLEPEDDLSSGGTRRCAWFGGWFWHWFRFLTVKTGVHSIPLIRRQWRIFRAGRSVELAWQWIGNF